MLVRDDRAWVGGGRTEPWIALFDAVLGEWALTVNPGSITWNLFWGMSALAQLSMMG
jgi:hypothetical protein